MVLLILTKSQNGTYDPDHFKCYVYGNKADKNETKLRKLNF